MELLFARLPPPLRASAVRRVSKFLLESTLTSVGAEASVLCNAVAWADPQVGAWVLGFLTDVGAGCKFLLESTLTSVGAEASVLCNAVAWADPQVGAWVLFEGL